jgi:hypothetical protein
MQCSACAATLDVPSRFCPNCGTACAPEHVGQSVPDAPDNVVYLQPQAVPARDVQVNPHTGVYAPIVPEPPAPTPPAQASYVVSRGEQLPIGDFFDDATTSPDWMFEEEPHESRFVGTLFAVGTGLLLLAACVTYGVELSVGAAGAQAGGFVLSSMIVWIAYLSLPREQQHAALLGPYMRFSAAMDRRVVPVRDRTRTQRSIRRERDMHRAMRQERNRRITELGEVAYRLFRNGSSTPELAEHGRRVLAIEQQMLLQDARMQQLEQGDASDESPAARGEQDDVRARHTRSRRGRRRRP